MANIKSAKKRILVIETKTLRNKMVKSKVKTLTKKVEAAVAAADKNAAATALKNAVVAIDKAAAKGIFHKNTAARKVSRLSKAVNKYRTKNPAGLTHPRDFFIFVKGNSIDSLKLFS